MARGGASPAPNPLPRVSFEKVQDDDVSRQPRGVHDQQMRSYGYNDFSEFKRPEHYIRYIEPLESELAVQVEYDMDEQDQEWLDAVNAERKGQQMDKVSYELFEIVMDRLEKEWFDLTKNIPKPDMVLPSEDSTCAICDDSEGENTNAIVFCDGCNLAVHQDCYGVPYIPEGQWLCRKCTVSPENPVSCILCPNEGGAFKQTVHGDWVHLLCAIWVPETRVANDVFMEPITGVDKISKQRWKLKCSICGIREGACIQCTKASCFLAFHATCARKEKLLMPMKSSQGSEAPALACYCEKHLPREQAEARLAALAAEQQEGDCWDGRPPSPKSSKTARAYAKTYKPGPPLVPLIIVERVLQYIAKVNIRHKREFVLLVCKYWSLKREARRGAAFLKRLHLEPWTASAATKQQTDEEKIMKLEFMKRLRQDLESIRFLTELSRKRESRKRDQAEAIQDVFSHFLFVHEPHLRMTFERIVALDRHEYFKVPVSKVDVPDYFDIIQRPMCWNMVEQKLERHEYLDLKEFKDDVNLVLDNAMVYNKPVTTFYKAAQRIKTSIESLLVDLHNIVAPSAPTRADGVEEAEPKHTKEDTERLSKDAGVSSRGHPDSNESTSLDSESSAVAEQTSSDSKVESITKPRVGDLEPSLELLELLLAEDAIKEDTDLIIEKEPLEYLFSYELPRIRLLPPPPPPPLPKPKRDRRADRERKRQEREAERAAAALDGGPGFRATRRRLAAAAAAEVEAPTSSATAEQPERGATPDSVQKKRRSIPVSPAPPEPAVVEDVNNQQSFKLFEQGWILSPTQRRGGRAPIERQPLPPPKKKQKIDRGKSQLSTISTSAAENETIPVSTPPPASSSLDARSVSAVESSEFSMGVDHPEVPQQPPQESPTVPAAEEAQNASVPTEIPPTLVQHSLSEENDVEDVHVQHAFTPYDPAIVPAPSDESLEAEPPSESLMTHNAPPTLPDAVVPDEIEDEHKEDIPKIQSQPPKKRIARGKRPAEKIIWIDELDTPAIRRQKYFQRKAEKAAVQTVSDIATTVEQPVAGPSQSQPAESDLESELTSLSQLSDHEDEMIDDVRETRRYQPRNTEDRQARGSPKTFRGLQEPKLAEPGEIVLEDGESIEGGTLVWAKAPSFPWWPAVVFEDDDEGIPETVLAQKALALKKYSGPLYLVRFYDTGDTWQWLGLQHLRLLGEDDKFDYEMISPTSKSQKWGSRKNKRLRAECTDAFRRAMQERETDGSTIEPGDMNSDPIETATALDERVDATSPMTEIEG